MTNEEKMELVKQVCNDVRNALQREADRLDEQAEKWGNAGNIPAKLNCKEKATQCIANKICVTSVQCKYEYEYLIKPSL